MLDFVQYYDSMSCLMLRSFQILVSLGLPRTAKKRNSEAQVDILEEAVAVVRRYETGPTRAGKGLQAPYLDEVYAIQHFQIHKYTVFPSSHNYAEH